MARPSSVVDRLAVCSWSLQPQGPEQLINWLKSIGIPRVQIALDPIRSDAKTWGRFKEQCEQNGIAIVSGMFGTVGEDYSTPDTIRRTGGVVPDETWDENWRNIQKIASLAGDMGITLVTFHAGFLPEDERDPAFKKLFDRIARIADLFAEEGLDLGFETGQETGETLRQFLTTLNRPNVGVNFDPANMILYEKGDPIQALRVLGPWLKQCHIKDATRTLKPGTWGEEVVVGTGEVNWGAFFKTLNELEFSGDCAIEREAGNQRLQDIRAAKDFVATIVA